MEFLPWFFIPSCPRLNHRPPHQTFGMRGPSFAAKGCKRIVKTNMQGGSDIMRL